MGKRVHWETAMGALARYAPPKLPTAMERCVEVAQAKHAYLLAFPETGHDGDRKSVNSDVDRKTFYVEAALTMGKSKRAVQEEIHVGENLNDAAFALLKGTPHANNMALLNALVEKDAGWQIALAYLLSRDENMSMADAQAALGDLALDVVHR